MSRPQRAVRSQRSRRRPITAGLLLALGALSCVSANAQANSGESYKETLRVSQGYDGKVVAEFAFNRKIGPLALAKAEDNQYGLLPRSIGEVVQTYGVQEFHLTFSQGNWNSAKWGYSSLASATGVELWTWFNTTANIDTQWKGLTHALAGLFCASLNQIDQASTAQPLLSFQPEGEYPSNPKAGEGSDLHVRYGHLPHEAVCTENLTPWGKLLPCQTKAGLASLFNAYRLFDGSYHSMGTHLRPLCMNEACTERGLEFSQTLLVVLDPIRFENRKDWTFSSLFERTVPSTCALADETDVQVTVPSHPAVTFTPEPKRIVNGYTGYITAHYLLDQRSSPTFDLGIHWSDTAVSFGFNRNDTYIRAHRYGTGYGGERGGLAVDLINDHPDNDQDITLFDAVPWYLKLYLHTLRTETTAGNGADIVKDLFFQPAIDRGRPAVLEMAMTLPANSTTTLYIDFDKAFIKYTEHPPDANRGFDIGAAIITFTTPSGEDGDVQGKTHRIYTESVLVSLPTPDFSMPYNVITLTCTVMALWFGSMFNLLTRRYEPLVIKD
ncbi:GPI transamidase component PIG-T [Fimicolochytrium jonesii]|uniref:GPI transamidase component PIG-T n=1 Tax=Fimicolochytrium jonesii TaxID=1396493 RepID=UPI0022FDF9DB|nr:GPI transamidase component PIG-T [Fimicolochytrium jonesii]KAI8825734.1 GPI transamidase component PIG-T [Fimicolochytrium jonesii]